MKSAAFFCDACGECVPLEAARCPRCGKFFDAVKCPVCSFVGKAPEFTDGCPSCGYLSKGNAPSPAKAGKIFKQPVVQQKTVFPKWVYNTILIALIIGMVILFFLYSRL